ncbi:MAG: TRAP transporter small permease [Deltaproteobacteria bacterium]|nr:TRAP transporter small permease [Deltaproteobacteria bacterium]
MEKLLKIWDSIELYLTGILVTIATAFAFYQVIMRYIFNNAPEWAEESVIYLVLWGVFIISSKLVRDDEHVGADFVIRRMPYKVQRVVEIINCFLAITFCVIVIYYGIKIVFTAFAMDERSTTRLRFPLWIAYSSIPFGTSLILLSYIRRLYLFFFRFDPEKLLIKFHEKAEKGETNV